MYCRPITPLLVGLCWLLPSAIGSAAELKPAEKKDTHTPVEITRYCGNAITPGNKHVERLIQLAFEHLQAEVQFNDIGEYCSHSREVKLLQEGMSDILWASTSLQYEKTLIPIRIPIYKGLLGYRLALIRQKDQGTFSHIRTLEDLKAYRFGQGEGWADTQVLRSAGLQVTASSDVYNLFNMLQAGRFDLFPRGLMEPWKEVESMPELDFAVEESLMIVYPLPAYIFVTPRRPELAALIQSGLERAVEDGSFNRLVFSDPYVKSALKQAKLTQRRSIHLYNPYLSPETPLDNKALWVDLKEIHYAINEE